LQKQEQLKKSEYRVEDWREKDDGMERMQL
jgi:hypothetical protein